MRSSQVILVGNQPGGSNVANPGTVVSESREDIQTRRLQSNAKAHIVLGAIEIVVGAIIFFLEIGAATNVDFPMVILFTGIFTGPFCVTTGICAVFSGLKCKRGWFVSCMTMCIFTSIVSFAGMITASAEHSINKSFSWAPECGSTNSYGYEDYYTRCIAHEPAHYYFFLNKCVFMICVCLGMFILPIVHASLCCRNFCNCCHSSPPVAMPPITYVYQQHGQHQPWILSQQQGFQPPPQQQGFQPSQQQQGFQPSPQAQQQGFQPSPQQQGFRPSPQQQGFRPSQQQQGFQLSPQQQGFQPSSQQQGFQPIPEKQGFQPSQQQQGFQPSPQQQGLQPSPQQQGLQPSPQQQGFQPSPQQQGFQPSPQQQGLQPSPQQQGLQPSPQQEGFQPIPEQQGFQLSQQQQGLQPSPQQQGFQPIPEQQGFQPSQQQQGFQPSPQ